MKKPAFVEKAEKDMEFEAEWVLKDLCDYADKNRIEYDFIFETFLKAFRKKLSQKEDKEAET